MKTLRKEIVASVGLLEVGVSEDELSVFESALKYALAQMSDSEVERRLGATREEVEGILDDLRGTLRARSEQEPVEEMAEKS
jgi:hypothetical protein